MIRLKSLVWLVTFLCGAIASPAAFADGPPLVVDDDGVDCSHAEFATIQAAVDAAVSGATIHVCAGTYYEQVTIIKDDLRLLAKGPPGEVVVDVNLTDLYTLLVQDASGVTIEGFTVRQGRDTDIFLLRARKSRIRKNLTTAAGHDGIGLSNSHDNVVEHNVSINNLAGNACGINVFASSSGNLIRHNVTVNNNWGVQVAGSFSSNNRVFRNTSVGNRSHGIRHINATANTIENNRTFSNAMYGIGLHGSTGALLTRNHAFDNGTTDLFWDKAGANTFMNNHCNTSDPVVLCEHHEGKGH